MLVQRKEKKRKKKKKKRKRKRNRCDKRSVPSLHLDSITPPAMALPRFNYRRISQSAGSLFHSLPLTSQKLKSVLLFVLAIVFGFQILLLAVSKGHPGRLHNENLIVVDKDTPISSHYKYLLKTHTEKFPSLSMNKKCSIYFNELYKKDHDWELVDVKIDPNKDYDKAAYNKKGFIEDKIKKWKEEHKGEEPNEGQKAGFELEYQSINAKTLGTEQTMIDAVTHLRVFGNCFLNDKRPSSSPKELINSWFGNANDELDSLRHDDAIDLCHDIEQRLFPWLSKELPLFVRWDGEKVHGIPKMSKYISTNGYYDEDVLKEPNPTKNTFSPEDLYDKDQEQPKEISAEQPKERLIKRASKNGECFLNTWRSSLNGKGIVLSVADKYEHDITGLLRVLRALNNKLPIQLVHKGDLSQEVQDRIVSVARADEFQVPLHLYEKVMNHVPQNFPKQEVWFVNAKRCIRKDFQKSFNGFANKLIAFVFNSFDDTILMDTDAVSLVKPLAFLESGPYRRTGAYFFKDRFTPGRVATHDSDYFRRLMPTSVDESFFEIPASTNMTLQNRYIGKQYKHMMEAGVVAIKRSTHFTGILISAQLNMWHEAAGSRVWGDKELFWLGQSISGNENYEFNKYDSVAVGELTPMELRPRNTIAHELCSTHPGHLSGDDDLTLLWINSGMRYCKVDNTWEKDLEHEQYKTRFSSVAQLEKFFRAPVRISAVLIPPGGDRIVQNKLNEPASNWKMNTPCKNYLWCAYDIVGASIKSEDRGSYIEYDALTTLKNEYLGALWLNQNLVDLSKYDQAKEDEE